SGSRVLLTRSVAGLHPEVQVGSHAKIRMVGLPPPWVKSLRINTSPALWVSGPNVPLAWGETSPCRNQNPIWASPLLSNRSAPKYRTESLLVPVHGFGEELVLHVYRAAKPSRRLSLSGNPPWFFQFQPVPGPGGGRMFRSSLEPPPVKIVVERLGSWSK